jgi:signal recognition particle GTPase
MFFPSYPYIEPNMPFNRRASSSNSSRPDEPVIIAVLGVTGAGKSTFINKAASCDLQVGHGITSCKLELTFFSCQISA